MAKLTLTDIANTSSTSTVAAINANNAAIEAAMENTLSRDGSTPNTMGADLDMNSNRIVNLPEPQSGTDAVRKSYVDSVAMTGLTTPNPLGSNLNANLYKIVNLGTPISASDAATKAYVDARGNFVATRTALKALDTTTVTVCYLTERGREGVFLWKTGDYATRVSDDLQEGVWIAATGIAASSGAWERVVEGPLRSEWFGVVPLNYVSDTVTDVTTPNERLSTFAKKYFKHVTYMAGFYFLQYWNIPRGVKFEGLGSVPNTRNGVTDSQFNSLVTSQSGAVFIAMGDTPLTVQMDFCSANYHMRYHRSIPTGDRNPDATTPATLIRPFDGTNQDASGVTKASLRDIKVFAFVEDGWDKFTLVNLKFIPSCPGASETYGLGGYIDFAVARTPANYDVGLFYRNGWRIRVDECAVVGYWREAGVFNYLPPASGFTTATANNESGLWTNSTIQSGLVMRSGDLFPVADKNGGNTQLWVRWSPSHRFDASGTVRITTSDTFSGGTDVPYTLSFSSATSPGGKTSSVGWLVFTVDSVVGATIPVGGKIVTITGQGGASHTLFQNCIITDLAHHTGCQDDANEIIAWAKRIRPAIELCGAPMRAVGFSRCLMNVVGPCWAIIGAARDINFYNGCYAERRPFKYSLAGSLQTNRGGFGVAGPDYDVDTVIWEEAGAAGSAQVYFSEVLNDTINLSPMAPPRTGVPFETVSWWNPLSVDMSCYHRVVNGSGSFNIPTLTAAQIGSATHVVNRIGKREGTVIWGSDTNKLYVAAAGSPTAAWLDTEGTSDITPS